MTTGAVITAGGRSTRLGPVGQVIPKGLLPLTAPGTKGVAETAIGRIVDQLRAGGVGDIVIAANDHPWFDQAAETLDVRKVVVPPTGEYDAVRLGYGELPDCDAVVVASSDNVFPDCGLTGFVLAPEPGTALVAAAWKPAIRRYTEVTTSRERRTGLLRRVVGLVEKPERVAGGLAKAGAYRFPADVIAELAARPVPEDRFGEHSMTEALLRVLAVAPLLCCELPRSFLDIGAPEGLDEAIRTIADEQAALVPAP